LSLTDEVMSRRVGRWPIVNVLHALLAPLTGFWRRNASASAAPAAESLVQTYLDAGERPLNVRVQTTFALLNQSHPAVATLYRERRLWDDLAASEVSADLRATLAAALERQREAALLQLAGGGGIIGGFFRVLLTVGALLWVPFIQPVLEGMLKLPEIRWDWWTQGRNLAGLIVGVLSGESLLRNVTFLIIWFTVIWLALRWGTQRRVARFLARMRSPDERDPSLNLTAQAVQWMEGLLTPLRRSSERTTDLARRAAALEKTNGAAA
jgi:hypothetical protein